MEIDNSNKGKYFLFDFDRPHGHERVDDKAVPLTDKEAKQKNYALAINKTNKLYVKSKSKS
jgi:hypothetical protein